MKKLALLIVIAILLLHTLPALAVASDEPRMFTIYLPLVSARYRLEIR